MDDSELLRRAANKVRRTSAVAPHGPYTLGFRDTESPQYRLLFADDGDPFGAVCDWSGGFHDGTGSEDQTGEFLSLWSPMVADAVATWLDQHAAAHDIYECRWEDDVCGALATARALLGEA